MKETYAFLFCFALGIAARFCYMAATKLAKRTDLMPVTIVLDTLTAAAVGGGFTAYIIVTGTVIAPYMFAALLSAYLLTYLLTRSVPKRSETERKRKGSKNKADAPEKAERRA